MTYFFETYGCQMNKAESSQIENLLASRGWSASPSPDTADLAIINTCSVRETAETRITGRLGWYASLKAVRHRKKDAKDSAFPHAAEYAAQGGAPLTLVVMGCMAERLADRLKKDYPVIDYAVGNFQKHQFSRIAESVEKAESPRALVREDSFAFLPEMDEYTSHDRGSMSAYVPIMHGCNNFCAYCIVPYVRGREVSRDPQSILAELDALSRQGVKEITLLGQNVNSYTWDNLDFPALTERILSHLAASDSPIRWVRFLSSHPKDLSPALISVIAANRRMCRHIHLPVQHGSDRVLAAMNRRYTRAEYLSKVSLIRNALPDSSLSTDILIGFPGETEDDVRATLDLMEEVRFEAAFTYYYNPREGTPAAKLPGQVPLDVKKERLARVIDSHLNIARSVMAQRAGSEALVLVEGASRGTSGELRGRTEQDGHVVFAAPDAREKIGQFTNVRITELTGNTFRGTLIQ
jgi:tRNA-2-methylthio-N6-dimethylallyladenosine synthase